MKLKYLPDEEKRIIRSLKKNTDPEEAAKVLRELLHRPFTLQILWEYRKWFYMLTEEQLEGEWALQSGLAQIYIMAGELEKAKALVKRIPEGSLARLLSEFMLPDLEMMQRGELFQRIYAGGGVECNIPALTAGRTSVINGTWDFTPYASWILENQEKTIRMFAAMYPEEAEKIYDLMRAEVFYQEDKCYDALVLVVNLIPILKGKRDLQLLFVALTLEVFILVINNQTSSPETMMANVRQQMVENGLKEYIPNVDTLAAWAAMYDGNYKYVTRWLREEAPDEYDEFCLLDLFRYMVKMRVYIIQGKHLAVTALANRLLPLLEAGRRYMDLCELQLIWAMSDFAAGRMEEAFLHMDRVLELAERYRYDRLIADEAQLMYKLLKEYRKSRGKSSYINRLLVLSEKTALLHPGYLKKQLPEQPALTEAEMKILWLLADYRTNGEIAELLEIAVDTVKQHCRHICKKLEVKNRHQAVQRAVELGVLELPRR